MKENRKVKPINGWQSLPIDSGISNQIVNRFLSTQCRVRLSMRRQSIALFVRAWGTMHHPLAPTTETKTYSILRSWIRRKLQKYSKISNTKTEIEREKNYAMSLVDRFAYVYYKLYNTLCCRIAYAMILSERSSAAISSDTFSFSLLLRFRFYLKLIERHHKFAYGIIIISFPLRLGSLLLAPTDVCACVWVRVSEEFLSFVCCFMRSRRFENDALMAAHDNFSFLWLVRAPMTILLMWTKPVVILHHTAHTLYCSSVATQRTTYTTHHMNGEQIFYFCFFLLFHFFSLRRFTWIN